MKKQNKSYGIIAGVVGSIILIFVLLGVLSSTASAIGTEFPMFYLRIDDENVASDVADYVISRDDSLLVDIIYPLKLFSGEDGQGYTVDIKANEGVRFSIDVDGQRYEFDNSRDWNQVFEIVSTKKGFRLFSKYDSLDQIFACVYEGQLVEFYIPKDAKNLFCATISSKDETIKYNVYFTLSQQFTVVSLDNTEILF